MIKRLLVETIRLCDFKLRYSEIQRRIGIDNLEKYFQNKIVVIKGNLKIIGLNPDDFEYEYVVEDIPQLLNKRFYFKSNKLITYLYNFFERYEDLF